MEDLDDELDQIRRDLEEAAAETSFELGIDSETGCCEIFHRGAELRQSGINEERCQFITRKYKGARCNFIPGEDCSNNF